MIRKRPRGPIAVKMDKAPWRRRGRIMKKKESDPVERPRGGHKAEGLRGVLTKQVAKGFIMRTHMEQSKPGADSD